jgi:hypothetical protein
LSRNRLAPVGQIGTSFFEANSVSTDNTDTDTATSETEHNTDTETETDATMSDTDNITDTDGQLTAHNSTDNNEPTIELETEIKLDKS